MKKILFTVLFILIACIGFADNDHQIQEPNKFSTTFYPGLEIGSSTTVYHDVNMDAMKPQGFAALQIAISGSGTLKVFHESSNDGYTFVSANIDGVTTGSTIISELTSGSAFYVFDPPFGKYMRINFVETGGANTITVDKAVLAIQ